MDSTHIAEGLSVVVPIVTAVALCAAVRGKVYERYPALVGYLVLTLLFGISFGVLPYGPVSIRAAQRYVWYFWGYWTVYLACGVLLFFTIQQIFREVMQPLPGLSRLGVLVFRWVVIISVILAATSSYTPAQLSKHSLVSVATELMQCVSIMELCLLAFVTLVAQKLGLSYRSRPFGIALGFGMTSAIGFVATAIAFHQKGAFSTSANVVQACNIVAIGICAYYFYRPEPARNVVVMAPSSSLLRWNEVALALGRNQPQPPPAPASDFFLSDVERVVEKVLIKNSLKTTNS
ncbi:MAG TPA: hypothetical protein VM554_11070 [Acidisarcina sp.]|nr:hypothetical protein [Acidisarcina sp.]